MMRKNRNYKHCAGDIVQALNKHNLGAYIYHVATTGSVYIRFADSKHCSIRVGDHDGKEQYKYKFNLRRDIQKSKWENEGGLWRFYCPMHRIDLLVNAVLKQVAYRKDWVSKFEYKIPEFKKHSQ